jgi:hypothetical protein
MKQKLNGIKNETLHWKEIFNVLLICGRSDVTPTMANRGATVSTTCLTAQLIGLQSDYNFIEIIRLLLYKTYISTLGHGPRQMLVDCRQER